MNGRHYKLPIKKRKKPTTRGKEHDLRGATLARLADDCQLLANEIIATGARPHPVERIQTLGDLAAIFRNAAKRERKLR